MGKSSYIGGSTIIGSQSGWFSYSESKKEVSERDIIESKKLKKLNDKIIRKRTEKKQKKIGAKRQEAQLRQSLDKKEFKFLRKVIEAQIKNEPLPEIPEKLIERINSKDLLKWAKSHPRSSYARDHVLDSIARQAARNKPDGDYV